MPGTPGHDQRHADQQAQAQAGEDELAQLCRMSRAGQRDHGAAFGWVFGCALGWAAAQMLNHLHPCACVQGFGAVQRRGVARLQPSEHLHVALQIVAAQRDRGKAQPICRALPHAALQPLALRSGQGDHRRGRRRGGVSNVTSADSPRGGGGWAPR